MASVTPIRSGIKTVAPKKTSFRHRSFTAGRLRPIRVADDGTLNLRLYRVARSGLIKRVRNGQETKKADRYKLLKVFFQPNTIEQNLMRT